MNAIILYDGECNLCNKSVQFVIKRDKNGYFKFASRQSKIGQNLLEKHQVPARLDSIILIENNTYYGESAAVLRICRHLDGIWKAFYILLAVPKPVRNFVYRIVAKNRKKWFGKSDSCLVPSSGIKERFL